MKFAKKNPAKSAVFYWLFLGEVSPPKFPVKSADFSKNLPLKILRKLTFSPRKSREIGRFSCKFWLFCRENSTKSADCSANFDFFPSNILRNRPIFPRICPWKSREILHFFLRNIRSPVCCINNIVSQHVIGWKTVNKYHLCYRVM